MLMYGINEEIAGLSEISVYLNWLEADTKAAAAAATAQVQLSMHSWVLYV